MPTAWKPSSSPHCRMRSASARVIHDASILNCPMRAVTAAHSGAALGCAGVEPGRVSAPARATWARARRRSSAACCAPLGVTGPVKSPTYAWVEPYTLSSLDLYHFDFYRFADRTEWLSSGLREYFRPDAFCIVEWPEKAGSLLPTPDLGSQLQYEGEARRALVSNRTRRPASPGSPPRLPSL